METTENKKLYVNHLTESIQLSSLLFAPIFTSRKKGYDQNEDTEMYLKRTKTESIYYQGHLLDMSKDFPLFCLLISKFQKINQNRPDGSPSQTKFKITELEIFNSLRSQNRKSNVDSLEARVEKFKKSYICIKKYKDEKCIRKIETSLVLKSDWDKENGVITVIIDEDFLPTELSTLNRELIDLREYNLINTEYAKSLFLYFETKKFKDQNSVEHNKEDLINRIASNLSGNREKNRALKKALEELVRIEYLDNYFFYTTKNMGVKKVVVSRNTKFRDKIRKEYKEAEEKELSDAKFDAAFS